ncbi:MAG: Rrf2 family transcriptional regulator [Actinobacteria bacterium]|nr:MAG: Rrf2 family transcriptional regulator [Actinomycetota bacterium]
MRISRKAHYAVRATAALAAEEGKGPVTAERLAKAQDIPLTFLLKILSELRHAGVVRSHRGAEGGYELARPADRISLADVIRAVEGPLANVHEARPEEIRYEGPAKPLREVWVAVRANLRAVLESVTVADLARGTLPEPVKAVTSTRDAWRPH